MPLLSRSSATPTQAVEDYRRHQADGIVGHRKTRVLRGGAFVTSHWRDVRVGDVLRVEEGEEIPADLIILSTSRSEGICYAETSHLDGDTTLKTRQACSATTQSWQTASDLQQARGYIEFEPPSASLYMFRGAYVPLYSGQTPVPAERWFQARPQGKVHLRAPELLLRGATLTHTQHVHGAYSRSPCPCLAASTSLPRPPAHPHLFSRVP
jgi:phospholipid-transporting ATPase